MLTNLIVADLQYLHISNAVHLGLIQCYVSISTKLKKALILVLTCLSWYLIVKLDNYRMRTLDDGKTKTVDSIWNKLGSLLGHGLLISNPGVEMPGLICRPALLPLKIE